MFTGDNIDMHIHTNYSDGTDSPKEVICWAKSKGLKEIAITDHDNVDGVLEAICEGAKEGIKVHSGIELDVELKGVTLHLLGYDFNVEDEKLRQACKKVKAFREERNRKMLELLEKEYKIDKKDVMRGGQGNFIGKPMMARALVMNGDIGELTEAFEKIFSREKFKRIKKEKISAKEGIEVIKGAGGIAVLAHPALIKGIGKRETEEFFAEVTKIIIELKKLGIDGVECIYEKHGKREEERFLQLAKRYKLIVTKGSDYHGNIEK